MMRPRRVLTALFVLFVESSFGWIARNSCHRTLQRSLTCNNAVTLDGVDIRQDIAAVNNILVVRVKETLTATGGGILLPDQAKERPTEGLVLAAGPGKLHPHTGIRIENPIAAGMSVLYGKFDGTAMEYNGEECQIIRDDDVLLKYEGVTLRYDNAIPVRDYVLVELPTEQEQGVTSSGVVIAGQVTRDQMPCEGIVVKVGEGRMSAKGEFTKSPVKVGDRVKFKDYAGNEVMIDGKEYSVVKMVDILATYIGDAKS